jgi:hypothetical protein
MQTSKQQHNVKTAREQLDTITKNMYQSKQDQGMMKLRCMKYKPHGQSQIFMAATPLHKAMEYEAAPLTDNIHERVNFQWTSSTSEGLIYDVCFGICRHCQLLLQ